MKGCYQQEVANDKGDKQVFFHDEALRYREECFIVFETGPDTTVFAAISSLFKLNQRELTRYKPEK